MITILVAVFAVVAICLIAIVGSKYRMPVRFKTFDEQDTIGLVASWAAKQLNIRAGDRRLFYSNLLWLTSAQFSRGGSIPVEELKVLAPFIDAVIEGKGSPQNQPAEYEDARPEILRRFKQRMQAEGLWPQLVALPKFDFGTSRT